MQSGYIESFNGKFRDEYLNEHWFKTLQQARLAVAIWRQGYNEIRQHRSLAVNFVCLSCWLFACNNTNNF